MKAVVVGAGMVGLACAVRLIEAGINFTEQACRSLVAGWTVEIVAETFFQETNSWGAGAIWEYPAYLFEPKDLADDWSVRSLHSWIEVSKVETRHCFCRCSFRRSHLSRMLPLECAL